MVRVWVYDPELDGCFQSELYGLLYTGIFQRSYEIGRASCRERV